MNKFSRSVGVDFDVGIPTMISDQLPSGFRLTLVIAGDCKLRVGHGLMYEVCDLKERRQIRCDFVPSRARKNRHERTVAERR